MWFGFLWMSASHNPHLKPLCICGLHLLTKELPQIAVSVQVPCRYTVQHWPNTGSLLKIDMPYQAIVNSFFLLLPKYHFNNGFDNPWELFEKYFRNFFFQFLLHTANSEAEYGGRGGEEERGRNVKKGDKVAVELSFLTLEELLLRLRQTGSYMLRKGEKEKCE